MGIRMMISNLNLDDEAILSKFPEQKCWREKSWNEVEI
jgi:hypothetical protein